VGKTAKHLTYISEIGVLFLFLGTTWPDTGHPTAWFPDIFFFLLGFSFIKKYDHTLSWRLLFSGMWCLVVWQIGTNASDSHATSNFKKSRKYNNTVLWNFSTYWPNYVSAHKIIFKKLINLNKCKCIHSLSNSISIKPLNLCIFYPVSVFRNCKFSIALNSRTLIW